MWGNKRGRGGQFLGAVYCWHRWLTVVRSRPTPRLALNNRQTDITHISVYAYLTSYTAAPECCAVSHLPSSDRWKNDLNSGALTTYCYVAWCISAIIPLVLLAGSTIAWLLNDCKCVNIYGEDRQYGYWPIPLVLTIYYHICWAANWCSVYVRV